MQTCYAVTSVSCQTDTTPSVTGINATTAAISGPSNTSITNSTTTVMLEITTMANNSNTSEVTAIQTTQPFTSRANLNITELTNTPPVDTSTEEGSGTTIEPMTTTTVNTEG